MRYTDVFQSRPVTDGTAAWIAAMPKVELHVHLEGATRAEAYYQMAQRNHVPLPVSSLVEWLNTFSFRDFEHFIDVYMLSVSCIRTPDDLNRMVIDFLERQAQQNVRYCEVYLSASLYVDRFPVDEVLAALEEGIRCGQARYPVRMALITDLSRQEGLKPSIQDYVLELSLKARDMGIGVGLGIGGLEAGLSNRPFREVFAEARRQGLRVVGHGGEADGPASIYGLLEDLQVERIGHGIRCLEDPALVETLRQRQIPLEVSPQSNYCTQVASRGAPHPIRRLVDAGLFCTVNSDDPAMFSTDLNNEYLTLAGQGFSREELWQLNLNAIQAAFLPEQDKQALLAEWAQFAGTWQGE